MKYPQATQEAITRSRSKAKSDRTYCDKVLLFLVDEAGADGWVDARDLYISTTHKAATRLSELSRDGVLYEYRINPCHKKGARPTQYRLVRA